MAEQGDRRAEEVVRALATSAAAVRLYPPTSEIPIDAIGRFVSVANSLTADVGALRYVVEPKAFKLGESVFGEGHAQIAGLAEALYAHQVGQLIIAPGVTAEESSAFLRCAASDPAAVREEGGLRAVTVAAGVEHLAVIELTLRASSEEGLLGLDLLSAPLDTIGPEVVRSAADWAKTSAAGEGHDTLEEAIDRLEPAARDMASRRVAEAMLQLDEATRGAVLAAALRQDSTGEPMQGMLDVVARMKPAALARLLMLSAARSGEDAASIMPKLELPPEAARMLALMLAPSPRSEAESGVPASVDVRALEAEAVEEDDEEEEQLAEAVAASHPASAAERALSTTLAIAGAAPGTDSLDAIGEAIRPALAAGAFRQVREALDLLDRVAGRPGLDVAVGRARQSLTHGDALFTGLSKITDPAVASDAAAVVSKTGVAGGDALLAAWRHTTPPKRAALEAVMRAAPDQVILSAGRQVRGEDAASAKDLVELLGRLGDRRAVPALTHAIDHPSAEVRVAAVSALAAQGSEEAWNAVTSALRSTDEVTAMRALGEIRSAKPPRAVPALVAMLDLRRPLNRSWEFKREIIECLREMRATEAIPVLKVEAGRFFVFGSGRRMLRQAARDALADLRRVQAQE